MSKICGECGKRKDDMPTCTLCGSLEHARMWIDYACIPTGKRLSVCSDCWVKFLAPSLRELRKRAKCQ